MITIEEKFRCSGCYACVAVCPNECLHMQPDEEGFEYPEADLTNCTSCRRCLGLCDRPPMQPETIPVVAYAAKAKSESLRLASSSGGIFSLLAQLILNKGGIVYGVAVGKNSVIEHIRVTDDAGVEKLRGSKYVQSRVGNIYRNVEADLSEGSRVLFSGTPCQIGGLRNYLAAKKQSDELLLCQDLVCRGVPPYRLWRKHLDELGFGEDAEVSFRDKSISWRKFSIKIKQHGRSYRRLINRDAYGMAFLEGLILRPSCHKCIYKNMQFASDVTLADFWNVHDIVPEIADDLGVSLVFVHTAKGEEHLKEILQYTEAICVPLEDAMRSNKQTLTVGSFPHPKRDLFFSRIQHKKLSNLSIKYIKGGRIMWVVRYIIKCLKKVLS